MTQHTLEQAINTAVKLASAGIDPAEACRLVADEYDVSLRRLDDRVMDEVEP